MHTYCVCVSVCVYQLHSIFQICTSFHKLAKLIRALHVKVHKKARPDRGIISFLCNLAFEGISTDQARKGTFCYPTKARTCPMSIASFRKQSPELLVCGMMLHTAPHTALFEKAPCSAPTRCFLSPPLC